MDNVEKLIFETCRPPDNIHDASPLYCLRKNVDGNIILDISNAKDVRLEYDSGNIVEWIDPYIRYMEVVNTRKLNRRT